MKLRTATLGCKVNQYETEYVREALQRIGFVDAQPGETADLIVVNTCTVTAESDQKSRKLIRRLARLHPNAEMVIMGCYATHAADDIRQWPQVSEVITDKRDIGKFLQQRGVVDLPDGIVTFGERHRAYVKIQDGCRVGCSYCIIPKVRPYLLSRPASDVLDEIKRLVDTGYREIVLTGIHLGHYGLDFNRNATDLTEQQKLPTGNIRLTQLVERVLQIDAPFRLRISSMEAVEITDELIELARMFPQKICPHFHLSMQSGSDSVLKRMRRRWLSSPFYEKCQMISKAIEHVALTTDVIVGFPGETDTEFAKTCDLVQRLAFSKVHVFPFSARQGTAAATMPDQIPVHEKEKRVTHLMQIAEKLRVDYAASLVGTRVQVLFETVLKKNNVQGYAEKNTLPLVDSFATEQPSPLICEKDKLVTLSGTSDRYLRVETQAAPELIGKLVTVPINAAKHDVLVF